MQLYKIPDSLTDVGDLLEAGEIDQQTAQDTLDSLKGLAKQKGLNIAAMVQNEEADIRELKDAEARIAKRRKAKQAKIDWLREYLLKNMQELGWQKITSPEFEIGLAQNPPKVEIDEGVELPEEFVVITRTERPNKTKLKGFLKDGGLVEGVTLTTSQRLTFK